MKMRFSSRFASRLFRGSLFCAVLLPQIAGAGDTPALPGNGFPASRYEVLWTKSPFAVASPDGSAPESPDFSLVGIAEFDGISYASIINKKDREHYLVSSDKDAGGLKLISITRGSDAAGTMALLQRNGAPLTLKLDTSDALNPAGQPTPNVPQPNFPLTNPLSPPSRFPSFAPGTVPPPVVYRPHMIRIPPRYQAPVNVAPNAAPAQPGMP
jgi:hypothetical protein